VTPPAAVDTSARRKARGAFFTPEPLAAYVTNWAVRSPGDSILEPSCGEAAFLLAAVARLTALSGASPDVPDRPTLHGVEMHEASAAAARNLITQAGAQADIVTADFFTVTPESRYDAVIGNPPYIRYQDFTGHSRARSREAAREPFWRTPPCRQSRVPERQGRALTVTAGSLATSRRHMSSVSDRPRSTRGG